MKTTLRAAFAAGAIVMLVGGCATTPLTPASLEVALAQGDTALDKAFNVIATAYLQRAPTMDPALKAKVKPILHTLGVTIEAVDDAERLGRADTVTAQAAQAWALIAQVKSLLGI